MKKIVTVVGARPQFVKAAPVSRAIRGAGVTEVLVHTGQHYDAEMSDVFFEQMGIPRPDHFLGVGGGTHGAMTGRQLEKVEEVLLQEQPELVLVYGDTNSTLAGALAAAKLNIPVAHVESGLRSFNRRMPEEINRILTDHVSEVLFAPTEIAVKNLANEGIASSKVSLVGDVMYDAAIFYKERAQPPIWADEIGIGSGDFVLCTIHRAENTSNHETLRGIMRGLEASNMHIVIPMHPRTRQVMRDAGVIVPQNVSIVPPVGYLEMVWLEMRCTLVATDSGGVQKEAYFHGKPCLTLREETEWVELVETGWNLLVGSDQEKISDALLSFRPSQGSTLLYGNGDSALKITEKLLGL